MKNVLLICALAFAMSNAFAQGIFEASTGTTVSPFVTASKVIESGTATALTPFASTSATAQARGVAGKEQLKDELVGLNDDMMAGRVRYIEEVRQPALRELFIEMAADQEQMNEINSAVNSDSELHNLATAVIVALMIE